ncbi:PREDICTED: probable methyltransferase PMT5 [Tarenaya hassleriana]|uniref:probable methyltransferase PMT5 n=1 Tax=Tarenaya hassleriana TaxID=28532 RepID=UPI00053C3C12|nr:PREDICTED: probable methyltransferase PMT5 [Tarenaya hassleriana]XP_010527957.1 PREDICTED: probable methyltransferase PMT5 [Tarenaya hassleriana]XP_019057136.1 PREDICTED: probable methyltransferase PMT5 [Tarenaya hassleriana]XP_019057137.1 PREDICTED: probable methyltransferase PMT5 [Tarenaya hassleriana]
MRSSWYKSLPLVLGPRPRISWLLLVVIGVVALVTILGTSSSSSYDSATSKRLPNFHRNYRRIKEQAAVDYLDLRSLSFGASRLKEFPLCGKEKENYVPCYNVSANMLAGLKDGEEFDRHCELAREEERCVVRPPKDYKIPLRWPLGRDIIWSGNVKITKDQFLSSGTMTKRLMLLEENQIAFHSEDGLIFDGVKDYARQVAEMIGLGSDTEFLEAGVRTVLDIGCGFGSFGAHLVSLKLMPICIAEYEATGSQVQLALERGLPAMIGNFISKQLPYPDLSFDMVHCAQCGIIWDIKDAMLLLEVDRLLKPGGYFVLTSLTSQSQGNLPSTKKPSISTRVEEFSKNICWSLTAQQDETFLWQKTADSNCYSSRSPASIPLCKDEDHASYYRPLVSCISGATSNRWIPIQNRSASSGTSSAELEVHGIKPEEFYEDMQVWRLALKNYWSLLTPLIFSDHPKRPGDEDPLPPFNMVRNVMDMNARYGNLNSALVEEGKSAWVMNVIPVNARNTLPIIIDRGFAGVLHDWCEPFPTYPRTYDMLHANELLTHLSSERCSMMDLFLEMDRILRPEGWVVMSDKVGVIEMGRELATRVRWEARVIDLQGGNDQRLLVCQKPFLKK